MATERRKPATGRIPSPPSRKPTTRVPQGRTTRSIPRTGGKSNGPLFIGLGAGGFVLVAIIVVIAASNKKTGDRVAKPSAPLGLEDMKREGLRKCDEGLQVIQGCDSMMKGSGDKDRLRTELSRGVSLITAGNQLLDAVSQKTNFTEKFDTTKYNQALKLARGKLLELK